MMADICPICSGFTKVLETRATSNHRRRRRECLNCKHRFPTWEITEKPPTNQAEDLLTELENIHHETLALEKRIYRLLFETFPDKFPTDISNICTHNNSGIEL